MRSLACHRGNRCAEIARSPLDPKTGPAPGFAGLAANLLRPGSVTVASMQHIGTASRRPEALPPPARDLRGRRRGVSRRAWVPDLRLAAPRR